MRFYDNMSRLGKNKSGFTIIVVLRLLLLNLDKQNESSEYDRMGDIARLTAID